MEIDWSKVPPQREGRVIVFYDESEMHVFPTVEALRRYGFDQGWDRETIEEVSMNLFREYPDGVVRDCAALYGWALVKR